MKNCNLCHNPFVINDRIVANSMETFVFNINDPIHPRDNNAPDHMKTEMAITYITFNGEDLDSKFFSARHAECGSMQTGTHTIFSKDPIRKHSIRYQRQIKRK